MKYKQEYINKIPVVLRELLLKYPVWKNYTINGYDGKVEIVGVALNDNSNNCSSNSSNNCSSNSSNNCSSNSSNNCNNCSNNCDSNNCSNSSSNNCSSTNNIVSRLVIIIYDTTSDTSYGSLCLPDTINPVCGQLGDRNLAEFDALIIPTIPGWNLYIPTVDDTEE